MKRLLEKVVSSLQANDGVIELERGEIGLGKRLVAWWRGHKVTVKTPAKKGSQRPRDRTGKSGVAPGRKSGVKKGAPQGANDSGPKASAKDHKSTSTAGTSRPGNSQAIRNSASPIRQMNVSDLQEFMWDTPNRAPGGLKASLDIIDPILQGLPPYKEILDICAGDGELARHLEEQHMATTVGYDSDEEYCQRSGSQVRIFDPKRANFGAERFDFVCAVEGMQDQEEREEILKAATDAMKYGGKMVLVDAIADSTTGKVPYLARYDGFLAPVLSARFYKKILADCGLKIIGTKNITQQYQLNLTRGWAQASQFFKTRRMDSESKELLNEQASHQFARLQTLKDREAKMVRLELMK